MRLALITSRFAPETSPGAKRATGLADALASAGHRLDVLTQIPNYPDPAAFDVELPPGSVLRTERDRAERTIWRFAPEIVAGGNLVGRLRAEARFAWRTSRFRTRLADLDGVIASAPFVFNLASARSYRVPMWLDVRDLTWEYVRRLGSASRVKRLGAALFRSAALANLRAARRVSTTTERQRRYLVERGIPAGRVEVVPNGVPRAILEALAQRGRSGRRDGGPVRVVYAGLLGFPQGLEFAVEVLGPMGGEGVELHLYGEGVDRPRLEELCRSRAFRNVTLHGYVAHEAYLDALAGADILLASLRPEVSSAMPSKIWEYMAAGKPVLFAGSGEAAEAIARAEAGAVVAHGDAAALRERVRELVRDAPRREQLGARGREWVGRHLVREEIEREWVERIAETLGRHPRRRRDRSRGQPCGQPGDRPADRPGDHRLAARPRRRPLAAAAALVVGGAGRCGLLRCLEAAAGARRGRLAVLTYHRVAGADAVPPPCPGLLSASPAAFARQMEILASRWRTVSLGEVLDAFRTRSLLPPRAVLVTFDDAYRDFAEHAWPVLRDLGLPVTLFVPTAFPGDPRRVFWWDRLHQAIAATRRIDCETAVGRFPLRTQAERLRLFRAMRERIKELPHGEAMGEVDALCSELGGATPAPAVLGWEDLRRLAREGVTLAPHTRTHPLLDRIDPGDVRAEVAGSIGDLRREIGEAPPVLAYPSGHLDAAAVEAVAGSGIELAFTTRGGVNDQRRRPDPLRLRRIHVGPRMTAPLLRARLLGLEPPRRLRPR